MTANEIANLAERLSKEGKTKEEAFDFLFDVIGKEPPKFKGDDE
ncbi:hypothetical protein SAMN02910314_01936 [Denitrobacterium detoxificans]|uniref:Uncharacterized protein n=1 Tax=Denitrobacterium detoxificans TaxID=79604 RepID=A0A1H8UFH9_9ACTN|nr:hypothetical protein SAMN02910314_01312 [Denitrobacterium detoxificans]SEP01836.1 hypothetical protein SAMN02910314_01936 [Denitrobacterium detoxificans]